jgi:hypothetical protein
VTGRHGTQEFYIRFVAALLFQVHAAEWLKRFPVR